MKKEKLIKDALKAVKKATKKFSLPEETKRQIREMTTPDISALKKFTI